MRQWDFIWPTDRNVNYSTTHLLRGFTCLLVCLFGCHTPVFARIIKVAAGFLTLTRHNWCQESFRPWKDLPFSGFTAVPSGNSTCKIREKSLRSKKNCSPMKSYEHLAVMAMFGASGIFGTRGWFGGRSCWTIGTIDSDHYPWHLWMEDDGIIRNIIGISWYIME